MQPSRITNLVVTGFVLSVAVGCASRARVDSRVGLPICVGLGNCGAGPLICTGEDQTTSVGPTVITDSPSGLSSDGRGAYEQRTDGVRYSVVRAFVSVSLDTAREGVENSRHYSVNLSNPVPGGGGVPLGIVTAASNANIEVQWRRVGNTRQNLHSIPIGQTVTADMMDVTFHVQGRFHVLQAGPAPWGHCHATPTRVDGTGTTSGTIHRASATKWVIDLPAGSVGRLFDLHNTAQFAVNRGLYYTDLHFEIGR